MRRVCHIALATVVGALACSDAGPGTYNDEGGSDEGPRGEVDVGGAADAQPDDDGDTSSGATTGTGADPSDSTDTLTTTTGDSTTDGGDDGAVPSVGCGSTTIEPGSYSDLTVALRGLPRSYALHVPVAHDGETPLPLVLDFHDLLSSPGMQAELSEMVAAADSRGFVVAHPQGLSASWNGGACCGQAAQNGLDDVAFARALVEELKVTTCVDTRRVYATGFSNGGFFAQRLACEAADVVAAVAPVAGVLGIDARDCTPQRAMPIIQFHGSEDPVVDIDGSSNGALEHVSVADSSAGWRDRNGCTEASEVTFMNEGTMCQRWAQCADQAEVVQCTVDGMGHCWPGNPVCAIGAPSDVLSATDMMLEFFDAHALP